jgi:hypothetical protein
MMRRLGTTCLLAMLAQSLPAVAQAQDAPLSELLVNLFASTIRLQPPPPGFVSHEAHFIPTADQLAIPFVANQQLVTQLATFPMGSSSGGFAYDFESATGTFKRATNTFGPAFAERALTNGRGRLSIGLNFQYSNYNRFEGESLEDGSLQFYQTHLDTAGDNFFEGDLVEVSERIKVSSATTTLFANYGVTNTLDVAVTIPFIHISAEAQIDTRIMRLATGDITGIHSFAGGASTSSAAASDSATGVGDVLLRGKYRFWDTPGGGLAASIDLRLPTGDEENLLGTGAVGATFTLIGSSPYGRLAPHFNLAYAANGHSDVVGAPDEFGYKFGSEFAASPRVTVNVDVLGRTLIDAGRLQLAPTVHNYRNNLGVAGSITLDEYQLQTGSLNLVDVVLGGKFNVGDNLLINANVLVPINDAGVRASVTPVIGFDYSF